MPAPHARLPSHVALAALLLCAAQSSQAADPVAGASLYSGNCIGCHGSASAPSVPAVLRARNAESVLRNAINGGVPSMGSLGGLSASQIADIAAYLGNSPGSLSFASTAQGSTSGIQTLTVRASSSLALSSLAASVSGDFVRQGGSCGSSLAAGASCTIDVAFRPSATGERAGTLDLAHTGIASGVSVALKGTATAAPSAPVLALGSSALSFSEQVVSTTSAAQTLSVSNTGNAALRLSGLTLSGAAAADFLRDGTCAVDSSLVAGASCTVDIRFSPSAAGTRSASLAIASDGGNGSVTLSGVAVLAPAPQAAFSAAALSFGAQTVGTTSAAQTLTLSNSGTAALSISSLQASPPFALSHDCGNSLAAKASCKLSLTFSPSAEGAASDKLTLVSNASGSP
ncbi:MAG TPA: choice-of-anchor D domain-containing protein, partial [Burkholderiaceae bacterium]|nr:choice-of-anchor D domain-containing protein [Burkholderiaceae bacterium]